MSATAVTGTGTGLEEAQEARQPPLLEIATPGGTRVRCVRSAAGTGAEARPCARFEVTRPDGSTFGLAVVPSDATCPLHVAGAGELAPVALRDALKRSGRKLALDTASAEAVMRRRAADPAGGDRQRGLRGDESAAELKAPLDPEPLGAPRRVSAEMSPRPN